MDITKRKKAEEELSQIFSMSLGMICIADINTATFIKINPAFTDTLGYSEDELLGKPFLEFVHPEDIGPTTEVIREKLLKGERVINFENRYLCKNGNYKHLSWLSHPVPEKGLTYAVAHDVTELKRTEEALRESEQMLRNLADNLPNAMIYQVTAEPDGGRRFTYVSRAVERLNEIREEDVLADAGLIYGQMLPEYRTMVRERETEALRNLTAMHVEIQSRLPSGRLCWFEYTSTPRRQADGLLVWDGVEVDITERKSMEEELLKADKPSLGMHLLGSWV